MKKLLEIGTGLNRQVFLALALVGLLPLIIMAWQNHHFAREAIAKAEKEHLAFSLHSRLLWLRTWASHTRQDFYYLSFDDGGHPDLGDEQIYALAAQKLYKGHVNYRSISLYQPDWSLAKRYPEGFNKKINPLSPAYKQALQAADALFVHGEQYSNDAGEIILPMGQALMNSQGETGAFLVAEINISRSLAKILGNTADLNEGGRYILATKDGRVLYRSPVAGKPAHEPLCANQKVPEEILTTPAWQVVTRKLDCSGRHVYSVQAPIDEFGWILISQFSQESALQGFESYVLYGLLTAAGTLLLVIFLAQRLAGAISAPLEQLTAITRNVSAGQQQERLPTFKEKSLQEVGEAFNAMLDTLEHQQQDLVQHTTLSTLGKMSSSLVHEMRNPLSSIKINLQALARRLKEEAGYREMADISLLQVQRLESMCNDLLQFSKPLEIDKEPLTFADLASEVLAVVAPEAEQKDIRLELQDKLPHGSFLADRSQSCRALINLVGNSIQWSENGGLVTISASPAPPEIGGVQISVEDDGPGLPAEDVNRVFEPFFTTRAQGTGLGLANVKKVMEYQGGAVFAENRRHGGARFILIFKD